MHQPLDFRQCFRLRLVMVVLDQTQRLGPQPNGSCSREPLTAATGRSRSDLPADLLHRGQQLESLPTRGHIEPQQLSAPQPRFPLSGAVVG